MQSRTQELEQPRLGMACGGDVHNIANGRTKRYGHIGGLIPRDLPIDNERIGINHLKHFNGLIPLTYWSRFCSWSPTVAALVSTNPSQCSSIPPMEPKSKQRIQSTAALHPNSPVSTTSERDWMAVFQFICEYHSCDNRRRWKIGQKLAPLCKLHAVQRVHSITFRVRYHDSYGWGCNDVYVMLLFVFFVITIRVPPGQLQCTARTMNSEHILSHAANDL